MGRPYSRPYRTTKPQGEVMKFYVTDILSKERVEFEAESFDEASIWVLDNVDPKLHYIGMVDITFGQWHEYQYPK